MVAEAATSVACVVEGMRGVSGGREMPSVEVKQENMASSDTLDPFHKAMSYLKFKIKNMEQRKRNLTAIKEKLEAGLEKQLELEQVQAAAKLPEVTSNIAFLEQTLARLQTHHEEQAKLERQRRQAAKQERLQQDLERVRRILLLQDTLMGIDERVREALLAGSRGAPQLGESALQQIDALFKLVTPSREESDVPFQDQLAAAAEHLLRLADRSQKKVAGTTYDALARTLEAVSDSGVLSAEEQEPDPEQPPEPEPEPEPENGLQGKAAEPEPEPEPAGGEREVALVPGPAPGSAGDAPPYPQEVLLQAAPAPAGLVPVPVPVPVAPPQPSINFLQESELMRPADPAVLDPAVVRFTPAPPPPPAAEYHAIPSQTFTNTNFAGLPELAAVSAVYAAGAVVDTTPNPPPPIPLPNHDPAPPPAPAAPAPAAAPAAAPTPAAAAGEPPAPEVGAWSAAPAPAEPAAAASSASWGDGEGDTEIGQWDAGATKTWDNGNTDTWQNGGDSHWNGDGRRGGYRGGRGNGGGRSRGPSNGFGGRGRGGYERPARPGRGGGYSERAEPRRGGERPYRGGRGAPRGGPARQQ